MVINGRFVDAVCSCKTAAVGQDVKAMIPITPLSEKLETEIVYDDTDVDILIRIHFTRNISKHKLYQIFLYSIKLDAFLERGV